MFHSPSAHASSIPHGLHAVHVRDGRLGHPRALPWPSKAPARGFKSPELPRTPCALFAHNDTMLLPAPNPLFSVVFFCYSFFGEQQCCLTFFLDFSIFSIVNPLVQTHPSSTHKHISTLCASLPPLLRPKLFSSDFYFPPSFFQNISLRFPKFDSPSNQTYLVPPLPSMFVKCVHVCDWGEVQPRDDVGSPLTSRRPASFLCLSSPRTFHSHDAAHTARRVRIPSIVA